MSTHSLTHLVKVVAALALIGVGVALWSVPAALITLGVLVLVDIVTDRR
ncbi:hypothetical protein [Nocardia sp. NPDC046763]